MNLEFDKEKYLQAKKEVSRKMDERLEEIMEENPTRALSACREDVVNEFKNNGLIKNYVRTTNRTSKSYKVFYFGGTVGFDCMYKIVL